MGEDGVQVEARLLLIARALALLSSRRERLRERLARRATDSASMDNPRGKGVVWRASGSRGPSRRRRSSREAEVYQNLTTRRPWEGPLRSV